MILITKTSVYVCMYVCLYVCMYVCICMYVWSSHITEYGSTSKVANPARGQLNRENNIALSRACLRIWPRETDSAVPCRVSLLISILRLNLVLTYGISPEFRGCVHLRNRHTPSGQSRVYGVTQSRTDGVHCRESAGTGPVNLKVVPNRCCLGRSPWAD